MRSHTSKNDAGGVPKMKIVENFENHQKWFKTSPEHENMIKYMILDAIQWTKAWNRKIKNWCSKCAFSQKPVPEAIRIKISSGIDLISFIFEMVRSTLHVFVLDMAVMGNWGSDRNLCDFARKLKFENYFDQILNFRAFCQTV